MHVPHDIIYTISTYLFPYEIKKLRKMSKNHMKIPTNTIKFIKSILQENNIEELMSNKLIFINGIFNKEFLSGNNYTMNIYFDYSKIDFSDIKKNLGSKISIIEDRDYGIRMVLFNGNILNVIKINDFNYNLSLHIKQNIILYNNIIYLPTNPSLQPNIIMKMYKNIIFPLVER